VRSVAEEEQIAAALRTLVRTVADARAWMQRALSDGEELGPADAFEFGLHMTRLGAALRQGERALAALSQAEDEEPLPLAQPHDSTSRK